jgi:hypothetical protein
MNQMDDRQVLVLTAEITVNGGHIDGCVRVARRPVQVFSGWSELFAVLTQLVSGAGGTSDNPGAGLPGDS